jgi:hypothetical protein
MARFNDKKAIGKDYTLGHMDYEMVHANVRKYNDPWSKAAFRNREPDPRPALTLICDKPEGPQAVSLEINPPATSDPQVPQTMIPSAAVGFPSAAVSRVGGFSGGGGGYSGGGGGGTGPPGPPGPPGPGPTNYYPPINDFKGRDTPGDRISGFKDAMPPTNPECAQAASWVRDVFSGNVANSDVYFQVYEKARAHAADNRGNIDKFLLQWMMDRLEMIGERDPTGALKKEVLWPFRPAKLQFLGNLVFANCEGLPYKHAPMPSNNCDRLEVYFQLINDAWLTGPEWRDFFKEINELARFGMNHKNYQTILLYLKQVFITGGPPQ